MKRIYVSRCEDCQTVNKVLHEELENLTAPKCPDCGRDMKYIGSEGLVSNSYKKPPFLKKQ